MGTTAAIKGTGSQSFVDAYYQGKILGKYVRVNQECQEGRVYRIRKDGRFEEVDANRRGTGRTLDAVTAISDSPWRIDAA